MGRRAWQCGQYREVRLRIAEERGQMVVGSGNLVSIVISGTKIGTATVYCS